MLQAIGALMVSSLQTQEQKQNREVMSMFQAWLDKEKLSSPHDPKNTADFKYITFTELPPFTSQHRKVPLSSSQVWFPYHHEPIVLASDLLFEST